MTDIVDRLRAFVALDGGDIADIETAADEIERLRAEVERHKDLLRSVEWMLDDGHLSQEHLARIRAAWEAAMAAQEPRG